MAMMVWVHGKILITIIQVNFVLISSEAEMRQHKLTRIVAIKILPSTCFVGPHDTTVCLDLSYAMVKPFDLLK